MSRRLNFEKMKFKTTFYIMTILLLSFSPIYTQKIEYRDQIYVDNLATPQVLKNGQVYPSPIIELGSRDFLTFSFDDLDADEKDYYYKVIHCDKDWNPSDLISIQYIDGFEEEQIDDYKFSVGTLIQFTHYYFSLPNRYTNFKISGNYIVIIYDEKPENVVLTRRFMVYEDKARLSIQNTPPSDVENFLQKQQMQVRLNPGDLNVIDPFNDIFLTVQQNNRSDNQKSNISPKFLREGLYVFDDFGTISFWGNNEFRYFDTRSLPAKGPNIEYVSREKGEYEALIKLCKPRLYNHYIYYYDFNGKFIIQSRFLNSFDNNSILDQVRNNLPDELRNSLTDYKLRGTQLTEDATYGSDYVNVIFNLQTPKVSGKKIYVFGAMSDWQLRPEFELIWDAENEIYLCEALLKQGFFDYMFVTVDRQGNIDDRTIDGSWADTENDYSFLVYFRDFGSTYDRLVGYQNFNSLLN